ncbi:S-adenosyl-L-methionine-dependent methyltransferase [Apodospora peruviana]|uniref:S-adenosyl-L-methionine-dependent methyltransferase n=1 Tax=Apodospora peruviana TaxID=516989 RepID=A0AAE0ISP5_9PEZI|nr:S-adenosyl-L-methionine-dependent methyltransferase [Apodospora peruviana]
MDNKDLNTNIANQLDALAVSLNNTAKSVREGSLSLTSGPESQLERGKVIKAARGVIDAIKQPADEFIEWLTVLGPMTALRLFLKWKVFENIPTADNTNISYQELADKVGGDVQLIIRLAWVLVSAGLLKQVGTDRVAHTPKSVAYATAAPNPVKALACITYDEFMPAFSAMPKFFTETGLKEPTGRLNTAYAYGQGQPGATVWEIMGQDKERMGNFMMAMGDLTQNWPFLGTYDLSWAVSHVDDKDEDGGQRALLVDVGGSRGHAIKAIIEATPGLPASRCVLEDLPEVVDAVKKSADPDLGEVRLVGMDFHAEQPVKGALVYFVRRCLHDYGDDACVEILKRLTDAMAPDSRLLIVEQVMSNPPSVFAAGTDLVMLSIGGKERTLDNFRDITGRAGLQILQVAQNPGADGALIECAKN